ncbi:hypothetical protein ACIBJI_30595 [Nocardia sp. NPDC050408]|uniref:hypothetical protein n=1 Tax=Nocardia sp. NPDC050408 TaxID=3364319 RepID=UPI0037B1B247
MAMGFNTINGLPTHILLVHVVVVLVPLAALMLVASVLWPAARNRLSPITPLVSLAALVAIPLTTESGEWLEHHAAHDPLVRIHTQLADGLLPWSAATFLLAVVWWAAHSEWVARWSRTAGIAAVTANRLVIIAMVAVAMAVSAGSVVQVYRIGDSGAKAAWHDRLGS